MRFGQAGYEVFANWDSWGSVDIDGRTDGVCCGALALQCHIMMLCILLFGLVSFHVESLSLRSDMLALCI